jgi:hypothetical protein
MTPPRVRARTHVRARRVCRTMHPRPLPGGASNKNPAPQRTEEAERSDEQGQRKQTCAPRRPNAHGLTRTGRANDAACGITTPASV